MGRYHVDLADQAKEDFRKIKKSGDNKSIKRLERIVEELSEEPTKGIGEPEQLKYKLSGMWSRKINMKDRIIYEINDDTITVLVLSALGHYSDK